MAFAAMRVAALSILAGLALCCAGSGPEKAAGAPSGAPGAVVLVSIDTLRADHLGAYGYARPTSPFLDELAIRGTLFEQAVSTAPWTLPAHASLLSGLYPSTHRAVDGSEGIAPSAAMTAELFQQAGYATGGFVASWFVSQRYGFQRGFDTFEDFDQTAQENNRNKIPAGRVVDAAIDWLRRQGTSPLFLFVHLYDAHFNYDPPAVHAALFDTGYRGPRPPYRKYEHYFDNPLPPELLAQEIAMYDGEIHYVDSELRRLHQALAGLGRAGDTLMVVTADHGEEFFERGSWGHAHTLYDEQVRVPLIAAGPGVQAGRRWPGQVRHIDLLPTLMEICGLEGPERLPGLSLAPILAGEGDGGLERPAFIETSRFSTNLVGVRRDGVKGILDLADGAQLLFDLEEDPAESHDLSRAQADRMAEVRAETLAAASVLVPDRWMLRWFADGSAPLVGRITSEGGIFLARTRGGGGEVALDADGHGLGYRLAPGGVLELAVLPIDAGLRLETPSRDGRAVTFSLGNEGRAAPEGVLEASGSDAAFLTGIPTPLAPAAAFWLEQSRGAGASVSLTEEEIRRLESLGYVMR